MTIEEIHRAIVKLFDHIEAVLVVIEADQPQDEEGFPHPQDPNLDDAIKTLTHATSILSRLAFKIARENEL